MEQVSCYMDQQSGHATFMGRCIMAQLDNMTEHEVECIVERKIDRLDRRYMQGEISEEDYRKAVEAIDQWAKSMLEDSSK